MSGTDVKIHALRAPVAAPVDTLPRRRSLRTATGRVRDVLATRSDLVTASALVVFCAALAALTWGTWGDPAMDTGYDLLAGARTDDGQVPYADYVYFYGPLAPLLLGEVFDVFGAGIGPAAGAGVVIAALIIAATYALGRALAGPLGGLLAGSLTAAAALSGANNSFVLPHTFSVTLAVLFALAALLAAIAAARDSRLAWFAVAGVCAGLVALCRAEFALALYATLALWLVLRAVDARAPRKTLGEVLRVAGPALAIPLAVYGLALTQLSLSQLVSENLYPVDYLREAGNVVLRAHAPLTAGSLVESAGKLVIYAAGAAGLVALGAGLARGGRTRLLGAVVAGGAAIAFLGVLAVRPDTIRHYLEFAYAWIPIGAWLAVGLLLWRYKNRSGPWQRRAQVELLAVFFLAAIATKSYASFLPQPNAAHPPDTPYLLPFAGAFLAWLHLRELPGGRRAIRVLGAAWLALLVAASALLVVVDSREETVTIRAPHGSLTALPADGPAFQGAMEAIESETSPGERILLAPQMTWMYAASGRDSALPQLSLLPGMVHGEQEELAIRSLEASDVRFAITDRTPLTTYEHGAFGETFNARLAGWLQSKFRRAGTLRGSGPNPRVLDVWQRRAP